MKFRYRMGPAQHVGAALITEKFATVEIPDALGDVLFAELVAGAFRQKPGVSHHCTFCSRQGRVFQNDIGVWQWAHRVCAGSGNEPAVVAMC
jgi:hypothetical protein